MIDFIAGNPGLPLMVLGILLFIKAVWPISITRGPDPGPDVHPRPSRPRPRNGQGWL